MRRLGVVSVTVIFLAMNTVTAQGEVGEAVQRGIEYGKQGKYDEAIAELTQVIESNPKSYNAYFNRAIAHELKGERHLALLDYNKTIEINPKADNAYVNRGNLYLEQRDYNRALSDYNQAIQLNPNPALPHSYGNRAGANLAKGNYKQALWDANQAIEIDPRFALAYKNRAHIYFHQGEYKKSLNDVMKVQSLGGTIDPEFLSELNSALGKETTN